MVNADNFKRTFGLGSQKPVVQQPQYIPNTNYVQQPQSEDPEVAKLKAFFLKWLSIIVGGLAIALIVWRIALKFI